MTLHLHHPPHKHTKCALKALKYSLTTQCCLKTVLFKGDSLNKQVGLTPHYYFIPTVYITRCVLACLVEVLTTRLSRIIPPPLFTHLEGNDAFKFNISEDM